jgi:2-octaprenyl-6-methoxyphenol hydroxylase
MTSTNRNDNIIDVEALIVGGGLVGLTLGITLASAGLPVIIVDRVDPHSTITPEFDGRATAIANGSAHVLKGIGLWEAVDPYTCPINDIRVSDGDSMLFLHYDHREIGNEPLGYVIENRFLRLAMLEHIHSLDKLKLIAPTVISNITRNASGVSAVTSDGIIIRSRLLLACDGRNSALREEANIGVTRWSYKQTSIICSVFHELPHNNVAHERFLPGGPFAILPMKNLNNRYRSAVVWTDSNKLMPGIMSLDEGSFVSELMIRFADILGTLELAGPRWSHPLGLSHANKYVDCRLALVGDAAHAIHPIAGQGLNMGIRDIAALAEVLIDARRLGLDIGSPNILEAYERWRLFDNLLLAFVTDAMNRLFSNEIAPIRTIRDVGLGTVNKIGPLRRDFMRHATGTVGDLPRLVRGEPL